MQERLEEADVERGEQHTAVVEQIAVLNERLGDVNDHHVKSDQDYMGKRLGDNTRALEASQEVRREQGASMQEGVGSLERAHEVPTAKPSQFEQRKHQQKRRFVHTIRCNIPPETEKHQQALILGGTGFEP